MADFYQQFIRSSEAAGAMQADIQRQNILAAEERRAQEAHQHKIDAEYRAQQTAARIAAISEGQPDPVQTAPGMTEAQAAGRQMSKYAWEAKQYREKQKIFESQGLYTEADKAGDNARDTEQLEMDQRIKTTTAEVAEATSVSGIYYGINDDESLLSAIVQLQVLGKIDEAQQLMELSRGRYTEALRPLIEARGNMSLTEKDQRTFTRNALQDAQTALRDRRTAQNQASLRAEAKERLAQGREKLEAKKDPKPETAADVRARFKLLKSEVDSEEFQTELEEVQERVDDPPGLFGFEEPPDPADVRRLAEMKAQQAQARDFESYEAKRAAKAPKREVPREPKIPKGWTPPAGSKLTRASLTREKLMRAAAASGGRYTYEQLIKQLGLE